MIRAIPIHLRPPAEAFGVVARIPTFPVASDLWRELLRGLFDPYRPERHYMRGPGPKWRAKHGIAQPAFEDASCGSAPKKLRLGCTAENAASSINIAQGGTPRRMSDRRFPTNRGCSSPGANGSQLGQP